MIPSMVGSAAGEAFTYAGGGDAGVAPGPAGGHVAGAAATSTGGASGYQVVVNRVYRGGEDEKGRWDFKVLPLLVVNEMVVS